MWYKWTKSEHDYLVDRLIKAEDNIEKLTKQLSIAVVGKCYTAQDIDKSYDQGYKDGATEENEHH